MVYIRSKAVKGEKYLYLVRSVWDSKNNTSRQETIKYLGKASNVTKEDIPPEHQNDPKIISFLASDEFTDGQKKEEALSKIREQLFGFLINGDIEGALKLYDGYRQSSGTTSFYEKILTPVMYDIGKQWASNKISVADEHVCSNIANSLVKIISDKNMTRPSKKKIVICTPDGEQHNLGVNVLESHMLCKGFKVYNISPSEPHDSVVNFIEKVKPDMVFLSITLADNIRPGQRLVKKIREKSKIPIFVGGQAVNNDQESKFEARILRNISLNELPKAIRIF
ncbi:cobalamin B12-binding domain-containing protein [Candidatus Nitrosotenuis sp. DW1]|uniref:cobalamin B12-binding domain-containing protein n=1 Tax=Candidatus Nitrosotenuis sp. DW1 TaxID=2259672 RepID=UPI0015CE5753|nr:cobalamin-dependent protein [Candidatus Nitrosotenuis sp. DW1]QLH08712.1 histidine kinase [Candidatus Nitrosotenuis sp. DW1]